MRALLLRQSAAAGSPLLHLSRALSTLAVTRVFIATAALGATLIGATPLDARFRFVVPLLAVYAALAVTDLVVRRCTHPPRSLSPIVMHVIDLSVAAAATLLTNGVNGPFFPLLLFPVLAAAYRWGLIETVATAAAAVLILMIEVPIGLLLHAGGALHNSFARDGLVVRSTELLLAGVVTGYFAQSEKDSRAEATATAEILGGASVRSGFKQTITLVFTTLLRFFGARRVVLVVREKSANRLFKWEAGRSADGSVRDVRFVPLETGTFSTYMMAPSAAAWHAVAQRGSAGRFDIVALDREGSPLSLAPMMLPRDLVTAIGPFQELMVFSIELGDEWIGRVFLVDPVVRANRAGVLGSGLRIVRQIGPAVQNVYLMHRLRRAAAAVERKHIARELHDGAIQTVSAVEMQVAALGIRLGTESPVVAAELRRLDGVLREEVVRLRELMQQIRPLDISPEELVESLGDFVQRFQRETGISARFVTQLDCVPLTPRACREVSRILLEALTNIRRHSGARNVVVRLTSVDGDCRLSIDDDGRGFPFVGRLSQADLEAGRKGPLVIGERVRLLGGHLTIDSAPGRGARLEIAVPFTSHAI